METDSKFNNNNQNNLLQNTCNSVNAENNGEFFWTSFPMQCYPKYPERCRNIRGCYKVNSLSINSELNTYVIGNSSVEEPMDLTCSNKRICHDFNVDKRYKMPNVEYEHSISHRCNNEKTVNCQDLEKRGLKRKNECQEIQLSNLNLLKCNNSEYLQVSDNKRAEVLKAAKSLFSKRTRTLYHWIYPNAPKAQLKAAVAASWETLGIQEKEFYISQVLGRFGFPQANLMINPQLGGLSGALPLPPLDLTSNSLVNEETSSAVSSLLLSENRKSSGQESWINLSTRLINNPSFNQKNSRKKNRLGRPPGSKNRKWIKEEYPVIKQVGDDSTPDEFQDDPELSREFQQFRWSLHLNDR